MIIDSLFRNNVVHTGGAIYSQDAVPSVIKTCYNGNTVFGNRSDEHLAMFILRCKSTISWCNFTTNSTHNGGAIAVANGTISITESCLQGTTAKHFGGALYSTIGISIVISDSEFNNSFSNGIKI